MPMIAAALPWIIAATGLASAGVGVGEAVSSANAQSDAQAANKKALEQQQQAQANQQSLQRQQAIQATSGQAQAQTGGSLTEPGFQDFAAQLAGLPGYSSPTPGQVGASQQTSAAAPTAGGLPASGQVDMQKILAALGQGNQGPGGNISGGATAATPPPSQFFELSSPVI